MTESADLFPATRHSVVGRCSLLHEKFLDGFGELFRIYRMPIYSCIRRYGFGHEDAEDLVQCYFHDLQRRDYVSNFDKNRGKFRAFIQTDLKFFLNNQRRKIKTLPNEEAAHTLSIACSNDDAMLDHDWAKATLEEAIETACKECGKTEERIRLFKSLAPMLDKESSPGQYDELAIRFGRSPQNLAVDMSRLRRCFGKTLERIVRGTLDSTAQEDTREEILHLFRALNR
jgi:DNA-directed RNA polymerase specialized sigma24 family protein